MRSLNAVVTIRRFVMNILYFEVCDYVMYVRVVLDSTSPARTLLAAVPIFLPLVRTIKKRQLVERVRNKAEINT